ncbi:NTF2-like domain containing protein, partial [Trema orientale]
MLIDHWIAQGFISIPSSSQQSVEQVALQYFEGLVSRCFLEFDRGYHGQYKMHDIIHDLAVVVAGSKYATLTKGHKGKVDKRARHVSLLEFDNHNLRSSSWEIPPSL